MIWLNACFVQDGGMYMAVWEGSLELPSAAQHLPTENVILRYSWISKKQEKFQMF